MFETTAIRTALPLEILKKLCLLLIATYIAIGLTAGYRAYHQIKSVAVDAPEVIRVGTPIETSVVSYGRTFLDVRVELIQARQVEVLGIYRIPNNKWAFMDPRTKRVALTTTLTEDVMEKFQTGPATIRATATGLPQLGHVPPPMVHEVGVAIQPH